LIPTLIDHLQPEGPLRVLQYITVRTALGLILAFALTLIIGPAVIRTLRRLRMGQPILTINREGAQDLRDMHGSKAGTPTMGGLIILVAILVPALLLAELSSPLLWMLIGLMIGLGLLGGLDDILKIRRGNAHGLRPIFKVLGQGALGLGFGAALLALPATHQPNYQRRVTAAEADSMRRAWGDDLEIVSITEAGGAALGDRVWTAVRGHGHVMVPFVKQLYPALGLGFLLWAMLVIIFASNAVNLTDGLDGLAIGVTTMVAIFLTVVAYIVARPALARYLIIPAVPGAGEVAVLLGCVIGAALGFLWFNAHPAEVFMGDVGSLTLGGLLGGVALTLKCELLLIIVGGIFVGEAASVVIQVVGYRLTGRRLFRMAPIHHHFEMLGWHESKIIARFWIIAALLALFGLATLKLR
jgi:phospho-N-acetylmuramoyl-pentapeptide-transferase